MLFGEQWSIFDTELVKPLLAELLIRLSSLNCSSTLLFTFFFIALSVSVSSYGILRSYVPMEQKYFFHLLPKPHSYFYVYLINGVARIFPSSYDATRNWTHISSSVSPWGTLFLDSLPTELPQPRHKKRSLFLASFCFSFQGLSSDRIEAFGFDSDHQMEGEWTLKAFIKIVA